MLEEFLEHPFFLNRHRQAPLLKERESFLSHLQQQGTSRKALRNLSGELLPVMRLLKLTEMRDVSLEEIQRAALCWAREQRTNPKAQSYGNSASFFVYAAKKWLRFHGRLKLPSAPPMRFADQLNYFARYMTEEQGLSPYSVRSHCAKTSKFLEWFGERHRLLTSGEDRRCGRVPCDERRWRMESQVGLSCCTSAASLLSLCRDTWMVRHQFREGHSGPKNLQIRGCAGRPQLGTSAQASAIRQGFKSMRCCAHGPSFPCLRFMDCARGEVSRLMLRDFDWREEVFEVNHSKRGGPQRYPLQREVGNAILQYLKRGRPRCACRHLFVTLQPPYRPIGAEALWTLTSRRLKAAGIQCRTRGPRVLRHACATRWLQQGASFKEIGDLLGHRGLESVGIYAKVDLRALRAVAAVDLGGLA